MAIIGTVLGIIVTLIAAALFAASVSA